MKKTSGEAERHFLVDMEHASRLVFWLQAFAVAALAAHLVRPDVWSHIFGLYNTGLLVLLMLSISFGTLSAVSWRVPLEPRGALSAMGFAVGMILVGYSLFNYASGTTDPRNVYMPLAPGVILACLSLGLLLTDSSGDSRWTGSYALWLFGLALILFMPLNETITGTGGYSPRDISAAYLGLVVSIFGSASFLYEDFQRRVKGINLTVGEAKYIAGKYDEAVESYGKALKADYNNAYIWYSKGTALLRMGAYQEALEALDKAIHLDSSLFGAWDEKGVALSHLKRFPEALECHDHAIASGGGAVSWNNKGNSLTRSGKYELAIEAYEESLRIAPSYEVPWYNKARSLSRLGRYEDAVSSFDEAISIKPAFPEAWHQRAAALRQDGRYSEAMHSVNIAIQLKPTYSPAWVERENLAWEMKEKAVDPALQASGAPPSLPLDMAILEAPETAEETSIERMDDPELLRSAGIRLARTGDYQGAVELFDRAIQSDPGNPLVKVSKAMTCMRMGHLDTALAIFSDITDSKPDWVGPRFMQGLILGQQGRYEEALSSLEKALELQPKYVDAWNLRGIILASRRAYGDAVECFDRALDINPGDAEAWRAKGKALDRLGRYDEAVRCYEKALVLEPGVEEARSYVEVQQKRLRTAEELFNEGVQMAKSGNHKEALDKLNRCLDIKPHFQDALYIKGVVLGIKKDYYSAMECFKTILEKDGEHREALFGLASAQSKQGMYAEAVETFNRAIEMEPTHAEAWSEMGYALCELERFGEALDALDKALALDAGNEKAARYRENCVCRIDSSSGDRKSG